MTLPAILFEDDFLIAFDKPSGLAVASDRWEKSGIALMDLVHASMGGQVANVHRLDADASRIVLCATDGSSAARTRISSAGRVAAVTGET